MLRRIRRRVPALLLLIILYMGSAVLSVISALGTRRVINAATSGSIETFIFECCLLGGIILGILLCTMLQRYLHDKLLAVLDQDWKAQLFDGLLHGEYAAVSDYHSGELVNRLTNDVRTINEGMLSMLPGFASLVTRLIAVFAVLFALDPKFTALLILIGASVILLTGLMRKRLKTLHKQVSAANGQLSGFLQEALEKLMVVQAMGVEREVQRRSDEILAHRFGLQRKRRMVSLVAGGFVSLLTHGSAFVTLVWCAWNMVQGTMTFGDLTAMTQLVSQLQSPFVNLSGFLSKFSAMQSSCDRLMELDLKSPPVPERNAAALYEKLDRIGVRDLVFSYDRERVLKKSTFSLPKGAFAVVTGPSGVGKSTLLKLLLGIFPPDQGELFVSCHGENIPLGRGTRGLFAYVPQGNLLFSGTLRENLLLTNPDASEEQIAEALFVSCLDSVLPQLPEGLNTMLGENAHGLSEGQAQRLSIARAVLSGAPVFLLDEATSALDAETEQSVLRRIKDLPDRTCVAVTHRPAALELADWQIQVNPDGIHCKKIEE